MRSENPKIDDLEVQDFPPGNSLLKKTGLFGPYFLGPVWWSVKFYLGGFKNMLVKLDLSQKSG